MPEQQTSSLFFIPAKSREGGRAGIQQNLILS